LSLALQGDGKVLAGGSFTSVYAQQTANSPSDSRLVRLNVSGTPDSEFDPKPDNSVNAIAVQVDGKIVIGGTFNNLQPIGNALVTIRQSGRAAQRRRHARRLARSPQCQRRSTPSSSK